MKFNKIIILCIAILSIHINSAAQLLRIDYFGKVGDEIKAQKSEVKIDTIIAFQQKPNEILSKKESAAYAVKRKAFHPPLKRMIPTSHFGMRIHPISGTPKMHTGIDLKAWYEPVYSIADGIVKHAGWGDREGYYVIINHGEVESVYCHLSEIYVNKGKTVRGGEMLGISGNTGSSTGPHLHFGVKWRESQILNPK